jgi:hypothetical protein
MSSAARASTGSLSLICLLSPIRAAQRGQYHKARRQWPGPAQFSLRTQMGTFSLSMAVAKNCGKLMAECRSTATFRSFPHYPTSAIFPGRCRSGRRGRGFKSRHPDCYQLAATSFLAVLPLHHGRVPLHLDSHRLAIAACRVGMAPLQVVHMARHSRHLEIARLTPWIKPLRLGQRDMDAAHGRKQRGAQPVPMIRRRRCRRGYCAAEQDFLFADEDLWRGVSREVNRRSMDVDAVGPRTYRSRSRVDMGRRARRQ